MTRSTWHLRAGAVVLGWLVAAAGVALAHPFVPAAAWLMVHLLLLGAVSTAILVWSRHFTAAVLRLPSGRAASTPVRLVVAHNVGALAVVAGVGTGAWLAVLGGGAVVVAVAAAHALGLLLDMRRALPSRFGTTVRYYVAAGACLAVGVPLGVWLARGSVDDDLHAGVAVAHVVANVLGWVGLTVLGTLVTLWPTILRTRMTDGSERVAVRSLPALLAGLAVAVAGALAGVRLLTAAGLLGYLVAAVAVLLPHVAEARRKAPASFAATSVLAGMAWLAGVLGWLVVGLATARTWQRADDLTGALLAPLLVGFVLQVLLGALSFLVPVVLGGGPSAVRATTAELERAGAARLVVTNAGLLLCVLPVPSLVRVLASTLVLAALVTFVPLLGRAVLVWRRREGQPEVRDTPVQRRLGLAAAGLSAVVLAGAVGVAADPAAAGLQTAGTTADVRATGHTTTVELTVEGMRYVPGVVQVPAGDRLVLVLHNTGDNRHDLVLENGLRTPRLPPGETARLDVGLVGADLDGWCSVPGHRQMGMTLTIDVVGTPVDGDASPSPGASSPAAGHAHAPGSSATGQQPDASFRAHDATLAPAADERVHRLTLTVQEVEREVVPGVRQTLWTYGGAAPGPTLRGRVGDVFEITLVNDGSIGHSVDFHAGALAPDRPMRTIQPGERLVYRFTASLAGIWMYHCSTMPMSLHIANGMFGAVVIDPPDLPPVDREYVLVQSELYLGADGDIADADRVRTRDPDLVVFNGYADQYDSRPLVAEVGERVRIWVLAAGPNLGSSFHVIGGQFDTVWQEGAYRLRPDGTSGGSQVLGLTPAQGGFVELTFPQAGHYPFVTHAMVDAESGAHGVVEVAP